jgi:hypothetical protein
MPVYASAALAIAGLLAPPVVRLRPLHSPTGLLGSIFRQV